jgi:signal transduction histidine kinase
VKHRLGSLEAAVDSQRRRNLAISFGILILLAGSMAMIMVSTQRAQRLAKLQMDFVAGVSHELRTPLAVIVSAGDNLAEGVVGTPEQVKRYGTLVRDEGRRLAAMVEQTLSFAAGDSRFRQLKLQRVDAARAVRTTIAEERAAAEKLGFTVEEHIEPGLPSVQADEQALSECLRNLIRNAVKYSGDERGIVVRASRGLNNGRPHVAITVEDHGNGIESGDLPHIFDPFYRGKAALAAQIHGSGLGLSLTREALEAMGGSIEVQSAPGKGSAFTIRLPAVNSVGEKA